MNTLLAGFVATIVAWAQPQANGRIMTVEQTLCLTETVYYESRGESGVGQTAVAYVVLNLTVKRNKSVCDVVHEPGVFSYYNHKHTFRPTDYGSWAEAAFTSVYTQLGWVENPIGNATQYNTTKMRSWTKRASLTHHVGHHYFYTQNDDREAYPLWPLQPRTVAPLGRQQISCLITDSQCGLLHNLAPPRFDADLIDVVDRSLNIGENTTYKEQGSMDHPSHCRTRCRSSPMRSVHPFERLRDLLSLKVMRSGHNHKSHLHHKAI